MTYRPKRKLQTYTYIEVESDSLAIKTGNQSITLTILPGETGPQCELDFNTTKALLTIHQLHVMADWMKEKVEEYLKGVDS